MHHLVEKFISKLKTRDEPLPLLAKKVASNLQALASGQIFLRACTSVGAHPRCFGRPCIVNEGVIRLGDDFGVSSTFGAPRLASGPRGVLGVGDEVIINFGTSIYATRSVTLKNRVLVGPYCVIEDADLPGDLESAAPIEIGDDVWLGARVVVRPGARIGAGSVIAAGSVVEGEIPPNSVASGAPARVLRVRDTVPVSGVRPTTTRGHDVAA